MHGRRLSRGLRREPQCPRLDPNVAPAPARRYPLLAPTSAIRLMPSLPFRLKVPKRDEVTLAGISST
ncbi:MAG TPA: hypothetical protein VLD58_11615, partial [Gemmatimonadales bacterium]|nr:hypothetical protein [Gemmatimonadales bacterium]